MKRDHGGVPAARIDASVNLNPLGPPPALDPVFARARELSMTYPQIDAVTARHVWAKRLRVPCERLLVGNGASELISLLLRAAAPRRVVLFEPCYSEYAAAAEAVGAEVFRLHLRREGREWVTPLDLYEPREGDLVVIGQPNNPTGQLTSTEGMTRLAAAGVRVLVDESFLPFLDGFGHLSLAARGIEGVSVVCSLTKVFCVPGLRLGWLVADSALIEVMSRLRDPWSVNGIAAEAAVVLAEQDAYLRETREWMCAELPRLHDALEAAVGTFVTSGSAPFALAELPDPATAAGCRTALLESGIAVRDASTFRGLGPQWIRLGLRTAEENQRVVHALAAYVAGVRR